MADQRVTPLDPTMLAKLYQGAALGASLAKSIGVGAATGQSIDNSLRAGMLNAGIASGRIQASQLSKPDTALIQAQQAGGLGNLSANPLANFGGGGSFFDHLGHIISTAAKVTAENVSGFVGSIPTMAQGAVSVGGGAILHGLGSMESGLLGGRSATISPNYPSPGKVISAFPKGIAKDFTDATPGTIWKPALDVASVASGGEGAFVRAAEMGAAATRAADVLEQGGEAGRLSATLGRHPLVKSFVKATQPYMTATRPPIDLGNITSQMNESLIGPSLPRTYSVAPFRRFMIEHPYDALMQSRAASYKLPVIRHSLAGLSSNARYVMGRGLDVGRGRITAMGTASGIAHTKDLIESLVQLRKEATSDADYHVRYEALQRYRQLVAGRTTDPAEMQAILDQYKEDVLKGQKMPEGEEGTLNVAEHNALRQRYLEEYSKPAFEEYFKNPTNAMKGVADAWDRTIAEGLKREEDISPWQHTQRSLKYIAHIEDSNADAILGQMPEAYQATGYVAKNIDQIEEALQQSDGENVPEMMLAHDIAQRIPSGNPVANREVVDRAIKSYQEDIRGTTGPEERRAFPDYIRGRTLGQKIAIELVDKGLMKPHDAERFMGGVPIRKSDEEIMPNYYPSVEAKGMKLVNSRGPLGRARESLQGLDHEKIWTDAGHNRLRGPARAQRLLNAASIGLVPKASYLEEASLLPFKQGIDRIGPDVAIQHVMQRERKIVATELAPSILNPVSVKNHDGTILRVKDPAKLPEIMGSTDLASRYTILHDRGLIKFIQSEDHAILDAIRTIGVKPGESLTADQIQELDQMLMSSAQETSRELMADTNTGGRVVPVEFFNRLVNHAQLMDNAPGLLRSGIRGFINRWRHYTLALMPSWFFRTAVGHGIIMMLGGVWTGRYGGLANRLTRESGQAGYHIGEMGLENRGINWPAGVQQGTMMAESSDWGKARELRMLSPGYVIQNKVHAVNVFQRQAGFIHLLNKVARMHYADLSQSMEDLGTVFRKATTIDEVNTMIREHPDWVHHALNELDRITYTFGQMAPWERRVAKNIMPFWGWYKFASKFLWTLPFTYPGRALLLSKLGQLGREDQDQYGIIPDWMRNSLITGVDSTGLAHYWSSSMINPLGDVINPFTDSGGLTANGVLRLGQVNPILQGITAAYGINPLTGAPESIDPTSGIVPISGTYYNTDITHPQSYSNIAGLGGLARFAAGVINAFPQVRYIAQMVAQGRSPYPENVPFLNNKYIPTMTPKPQSTGNLIAEWTGFAQKQYNLGAYERNLLKRVLEARRTQFHDIAKQAALAPK